jgi:hypothetical protein
LGIVTSSLAIIIKSKNENITGVITKITK